MCIFEEKLSDLALILSHKQFWHHLLNWIPSAAGILNHEGQWVLANTSAHQLLGENDQGVIRQYWCHPEDFKTLQKIFTASRAIELNIRLPLISTNSKWQIVKATVVPLPVMESFWLCVFEGNGQNTPVLPKPVDSNLVFRHLVEMAPIMIGMYIDEKIVYVNPAGIRLMGADSLDDLIGRNVMEFIHPDSLPVVERRKQMLLNNQMMLPPVEERLIRLDGEVIDVEVVTTRLALEGQLAILAVGQDITRRKQTERALKESEERYFHLMQVSPNAIFIVQNLQICYVNPAGLQLLGVRDSQQLLGQRIDQFLPAVSQQLLSQADNSWKGRSQETQLFPLEGKPLEVDVIATPVMLEGQVSIQLIVRDISNRKRSEIQLKESRDRLRELSVYLQNIREKERSHIAREIHDELGQMLTALKLELALLKRRLLHCEPSVVKNMDTMSQMVDDTVKVVRRIAAELRPEILDDLGLLAAIEWQAQEYQNRSGLKIYVRFEPEDFAVDRNRATTIFRIFQETLTNVVRHAQASEVFVTLARKSDGLELVVEDDGIGMNLQRKEKRWTLGIMGIKERARFWDGKVTITSVPGEGTRVQVWIPEDRHD